jgi:hypothetical protein
MPRVLTAPVLAALEAGTIAHGWLIDLFTDEGTLRAWDKPMSITYGGNLYEPLGDSFELAGELRLGPDLVPEPLTFTFDTSPADDDASFVGRLLDRQWHQRKARLTGILFVPGTNFQTQVGKHIEWNGVMDTIETAEIDNGQSRLVLNCEGGIFRALDRNMTTCTDFDQKKRDPVDRFFGNVALKPRQDVPFGRSWSNIPGGSGRGDGGASGGSTGIAGGSGRGGFSRLN